MAAITDSAQCDELFGNPLAFGPPELSPADSLLSLPSDAHYPSLFPSTPDSSQTINPVDVMSPESFTEDNPILTQLANVESVASISAADTKAAPVTPEKKPTKKRKSWGQVLPEPKTNLPPRKRAKTEAEKEQRRVERVLRNRRAAQSSRERKRLEVEALEAKNKELEQQLAEVQRVNSLLTEELFRYQKTGGDAQSSSTLHALQGHPLTLTTHLFPCDLGDDTNPLSSLLKTRRNQTVNPASLSPSLDPVPDTPEATNDEQPLKEEKPEEQNLSAAPVSSRHPAVLSSDLPCQRSRAMESLFLDHLPLRDVESKWCLRTRIMLNNLLRTQFPTKREPPMETSSISWALKILPSNSEPTPQLMATLIRLVTLPRSTSTRRISTSASTSTTPSLRRKHRQRATSPLLPSEPREKPTVRPKSLQKILSSSPSLARPLAYATLVALRMVSERRGEHVDFSQRGFAGQRGYDRELTDNFRSIGLPPKAALREIGLILMAELEKSRWTEEDAILDLETC